MSKPTPRPWRYSGSQSSHSIAGKGGDWVAQCNDGRLENNEENAKHIVMCVNMHDDLVQMLELSLNFLRKAPALASNQEQDEESFREQVKAVLAKAEADEPKGR